MLMVLEPPCKVIKLGGGPKKNWAPNFARRGGCLARLGILLKLKGFLKPPLMSSFSLVACSSVTFERRIARSVMGALAYVSDSRGKVHIPPE